ncbi:hypothetical protein M3654_23500, partial [Bacillus licheniformis]|nr:hypothetical protein [Bacillus licheniformis]
EFHFGAANPGLDRHQSMREARTKQRPSPLAVLPLPCATRRSKFGRIMRHGLELLKPAFFIDCKIYIIQRLTQNTRIPQTISHRRRHSKSFIERINTLPKRIQIIFRLKKPIGKRGRPCVFPPDIRVNHEHRRISTLHVPVANRHFR